MLSVFRGFYPTVKRGVDFIGAVLLLLLLFPLLFLVWALVRINSKGPGIFWSERVGRDGHIFKMPKFRTMTTCSKVMSRELATHEDCRLTSIGQFLRNTSIDELPQLWSIAVGDMSFIGPRPVLPCDEAAQYRRLYDGVSHIRPGITGLAQIKGRNFVNPRNKARYDAFYARELCLMLDVRIVVKTFGILRRTELIK